MNVFQTIQKFLINKVNIASLIALSLTIALCQFCVYALINYKLGKEMLGVWSLVIAATSIGQISNFGFGNSLVRFLPEMFLKKENSGVQKMIGTINSASFLLVLPVLVILYFPAAYYGRVLLNAGQYAIFQPLMILSLITLFINNLFLVYSYTFDSLEKHYVRVSVQIFGWILFLILSFLLLPYFGLTGVAIAMLVQNVIQLFIILFLIAKTGILKRIFPLGFDRKSFRKIYSFGIHSQAISILSIFFDPIIKFFITANLGLTATGTYEIANKIAIQLRNLLVSANQVIIPRIIIHRNKNTESLFFRKISSTNSFLAVTAGMVVILIAPIATYFFSTKFDWTLVQCILLLNLGWTFNSITSVHYYSAIGLDKISKLVISHLIQALVILVLYLFLQSYSQNILLYFIVPSIALFAESIYNSYFMKKSIIGSFKWLKSANLFYFVMSSLVLISLFQYSNYILLILFPAFILIYIYMIFTRLKNTQFDQLF